MPIKNGTTYHHECHPRAIMTIEKARLLFSAGKGYRLRIYYGDPATGLWWGDTQSGYIGRSAGPTKVPILLWNKLSRGGCAILDNCIVKIEYANKRQGGILFDIIKQEEEIPSENPFKRIH